jgi:hydroxyacylglutathione hydrolase
MFNWAFAQDKEADFVQTVLTGQPEPPRYFAQMKRINRAGPALLNGFGEPPVLAAADLERALSDGGVLVDTRRPDQFARRHIAGTINIPFDGSFTTWAGWLLPYDRPLYLLVDSRLPRVAAQLVKTLAVIGLDDVRGQVTEWLLDDWAQNGGALSTVSALQSPALAAELETGSVEVVDVRSRSEWAAGHLAGARHIPLGELTDHLKELPRDGALVVHCQSGTRSAIAASLLQAHGFQNVRNLVGGFADWQRKGLAVERSEPELEGVP